MRFNQLEAWRNDLIRLEDKISEKGEEIFELRKQKKQAESAFMKLLQERHELKRSIERSEGQ